MEEETVKIKYTVTYRKTVTVPAHYNEEDFEVEERIGLYMDNSIIDYTDAEVIEHSEPTIIDRNF